MAQKIGWLILIATLVAIPGCADNGFIPPDPIAIAVSSAGWSSQSEAGAGISFSSSESPITGTTLIAQRETAPAESATGQWANTVTLDTDEVVGRVLTLRVNVVLDGVTAPGVFIALRADDIDSTGDPDEPELFASTEGTLDLTGSVGVMTYEVSLASLPSTIDEVTVILGYAGTTTGRVSFNNPRLEAL